MQTISATATAKALVDNFICWFGPPASILSDQGGCFTAKVNEDLAKIFKIEKYHATAWHPQSSGSIERMHHVLCEYLKHFVDNVNDWVDHVPLAMLAYNSSPHTATGYAPLILLTGRPIRSISKTFNHEKLTSYDKYLEGMLTELEKLHTLAAMSQLQAKIR